MTPDETVPDETAHEETVPDETVPDDAAVDEAARERPAVEEVALADEPEPTPTEPEPTPTALDDPNPNPNPRRPRHASMRPSLARTPALRHPITTASTTPTASTRSSATPAPVPAGSVRRETYVPASTAAAAGVAGAATLAPEPEPLHVAPTPGPQTIYVQAPIAPKAKGNRGFGILVALIGTVLFALLYAAIGYLLLLGEPDPSGVFAQFLVRAVFWVPVVAFFLGFMLLAVIINRGPWWTYAVFGLLVRPSSTSRTSAAHSSRCRPGRSHSTTRRRSCRSAGSIRSRSWRRRSPARSRSGSAAGSPHAAAPSPSATGSHSRTTSASSPQGRSPSDRPEHSPTRPTTPPHRPWRGVVVCSG